jgi:nucleoside-diphosphate-sugar epimerase
MRSRVRQVITGGAGFLGQRLARLLAAKGAPVVLFDLVEPGDASVRRAVSFVQGDVTVAADLDRLDLKPGDVVHHLAARQFGDAVPWRGRYGWFSSVNVAGTREVIAAMTRAGANRMVYVSTDMTYGLPRVIPVPPTHAQRPLGPYGASKLAAERLIKQAGKEGIKATIFRPRLITGPGRLGIFSRLFRLIRRDLPVPLVGNGANRYQMISVDDCARAAARAVELGCPAGPFNLGSASPPTTRELINSIIRHANSRSVVMPTPAPLVKGTLWTLDALGLGLMYPEQFRIADADILLDTSETRRVLGWEPADDDTSSMIAAYRAFRGLTEVGRADEEAWAEQSTARGSKDKR